MEMIPNNNNNKSIITKLCLNRLIDDLIDLKNNHQSADVIFIVNNNNDCQQRFNNDNQNEMDGHNQNENDGHNQKYQKLYAHRLILTARCKNFKNVSMDICCRKIYGCTITIDDDDEQKWIIKWPIIKSNLLEKILNYIYTSNIDDTNGGDLFELLFISYEFGLIELIDIYEQQIINTINIDNVCHYLNNSIDIYRKNHENSINRIIDICMQFISEHANECVKTEAFLNISKETIIHLLRSDQFSLDEAMVFRSTVEWAKYQIGIRDKSNEHLNDNDRKCLQNQLSGVINHIRILLIDSQVFAEELEPIGIIPIELSLERYRFAALSQKPHNNDKRLRPRLVKNVVVQHCRLFSESKLLSNINDVKYEQIINDWCNNDNNNPEQRWRLIFRASEHKFSAEAFHNYCNGVAPTIVFVLSTKGYLSGGYTDIPWSSGNRGRGCYASSEKSFLFRLKIPDDDNCKPIKFDVKKKIFAIGHMSNKGPVFGAGADLLIADSCHLNEDSYSNLPHSYNGLNASMDTLFGSYYFTVIDYEVFTY